MLTFTYVGAAKRDPEQIDDDEFNYNARNGLNYQKALYAHTDDGGGIFLAGFLGKVLKECDKRKIKYTFTDKRIKPPEDVDLNVLENENFRYMQKEVIQSIMGNDKGVIVCCTAFGKSFIIRLLSQIYYKHNIVIVTARSSVVSSLYRDLVEHLGNKQVGLIRAGTGVAEESKRIRVSTAASIARAGIDKCDILLFDEVHNVGDNKIADTLINNMGHGRMFGFTASLHRGDKALSIITGLFGDVLVKVPYADAVDNGVVVPLETIMIPLLPIPNEHYYVCDDNTRNKRSCYWRNKRRNDLIASVATDIRNMCDGQILIMVDTLEHAIMLHRDPRLADFVVVTSGMSQKDKILGEDTAQYKMTSKQREKIQKDFELNKLKYVICTKVWVEGVNFVQLTYLIRADGATSPVACTQIPGRIARLDAANPNKKGIMIDFDDQFEPLWAASRSMIRREFYKRQGWMT